jgi:hypothetical protein
MNAGLRHAGILEERALFCGGLVQFGLHDELLLVCLHAPDALLFTPLGILHHLCKLARILLSLGLRVNLALPPAT